MKLCVFTIVLDGMPWLPSIFTTLNSARVDWRWIVVEGAAMNVKDSAHCRELSPRLSNDGTTEFLETLNTHPRVSVIQNNSWNGKVSMCNAALELLTDPCLLMQIDADEIWRPDQLETLCGVAEEWPVGTAARFFCRYFVGPNIITFGDNNYGNRSYEWIRAWSFQKGMKFKSHCPPILEGADAPIISRDETKSLGMVFSHYAYTNRKQVEFKCKYYGYDNGVECWEKLQHNTVWPVRLKEFLPWTDDNSEAIRL